MRHGHGQVGLAGARRADAEHQVVALDGFQVAPLVDRFRRQHLLAEIALPAALHQGAQRHLGVERHHAQVAVQVAVVEDVAFAHQRVVVFQDALRAGDVLRFAFDFEVVVDQLGVDAQARFDQPDVFIAGAEQAFDASADAHASFHRVGAGYLQEEKRRQERTARWEWFEPSTTRLRGRPENHLLYYTGKGDGTFSGFRRGLDWIGKR